MAIPEKWQPARELERFRHQMDALLERSWFEHHRLKNWESPHLRPALESFVNGDQFTIRVDLPGIDPESIDVGVVAGFLTIKGSREEKQESKHAQYYRRETRYGVFERTIQLPEGLKAQDFKATHRNGVFGAHRNAAQGRRIQASESPSSKTGGRETRRRSEALTACAVRGCCFWGRGTFGAVLMVDQQRTPWRGIS